MRTLNLGILAHVDAGKTSLTERLLHAAGVIDEVGRVDDGSTQTDSLALERQRGITIKSAVVSFEIGGTTVNLIDTPGHPDFIAEVERVLGVLDGAVLVVSAVEGVQAQTRVLMRALRRLRIPTLVFVNKVDRGGARPESVLRDVATFLTPAVIPMGRVRDAGDRAASVLPGIGDGAVEVLAEQDDAVLAAYVEGRTVPLGEVLAEQTRRCAVHPVYSGSAITGAGVPELAAGVVQLLPASTGDPDGPVSGSVFKVERGPAGERIAYVRMFSGTVRVRDRVLDGERVTALSVFSLGAAVRCDAVRAGQVAKLWGLEGVRIGDVLGEPPPSAAARMHRFAPPTLETVVVPAREGDAGALHAALTQLAEQDPLIDLRHDGVRREMWVSLYGEVQKEVLQATLAAEYGLDVEFRETTTLCLERPVGVGTAVDFISGDGNPFLATVGLRVEPGDGVTFRLGVELGSMPFSFFKAVEETVRETLAQGLRGWQVTDCAVTMTHAGYWARQSHSHGTFDKSMSSTAGDFRLLTPLVLVEALRSAGTEVLSPVHRFTLEVPGDVLGAVTPVMARLRAVLLNTSPRGRVTVVEGEVPAAFVHEFQRSLPALTRGEGVLETSFSHHAPVRTEPPQRPRTDHNPLNRKEYLLRVTRRTD
ncbi:translation factor GTPase family protein [Actinosynnema sp. NPDC023658]|uniref:translation factor GTPase family protein n=1 Tax=Actinosynnema sp. NPDC023658 TaxID=3155465 RepID=UPI0033C43DF1